MGRKRGGLMILALVLALGVVGCPKRVVKIDDQAVSSREGARPQQEDLDKAREEALRQERERAEQAAREAARLKEEEARKAAEAAEEAERKKREFQRNLVPKKELPGIEGKVFDSRLLKDVHFDFDRYDIRDQDAQILKENAAILLKYPDVKVQIEGHCDERGTAEYNLALGERRANSVKKYLISLGVPAERLSTISYGKEMPLDPGHNEQAWAKNRRAHFTILMK